MMCDSGFTTIIFVFWGKFSTWRHPIRLGKLGERDLSLLSHSMFERCFVSTKRHLSGPRVGRYACTTTVTPRRFGWCDSRWGDFFLFHRLCLGARTFAVLWFCFARLSPVRTIRFAVRPGNQWTDLGSRQRHEWDLGFCQKHCSFLLPTLEFASCPRGSHGRLACLRLPRKQLQHRLCDKYRG